MIIDLEKMYSERRTTVFRIFRKRKEDIPESKRKQKAEINPQREGLFAEVWDLFKATPSPHFFDEGITLTECLFREEDGMIDIFVIRNGQDICFNLDNETILMSDDDGEYKTVELTEFADLEDLRVRMNHFVVSHT